MLKLLRLPVLQFGTGILLITALLVFLIPGSISTLLSPGFFMPHRHCYLNDPRMVLLQGISDVLIGTSYMVISAALVYMVRRARNDIPFDWIKSRHYVGVIDEAAKRMEHLIDDLLSFSRLGRTAMETTEVNIQQLVEEARQLLAPTMTGRVVEWNIGPLPRVRADPTLMQSVIVNLLSNALKYSRFKNPARIEIGSEEKDEEVIVFVRDNGAGFDMRFVDKLFGVFHRLHRAEEFEGTALG